MILVLGIYPDKTIIQKDTCTPIMFTAALFTKAKTWEQPKCPLTEEWIKKVQRCGIHTGVRVRVRVCVCVCVCVCDGTPFSHKEE